MLHANATSQDSANATVILTTYAAKHAAKATLYATYAYFNNAKAFKCNNANKKAILIVRASKQILLASKHSNLTMQANARLLSKATIHLNTLHLQLCK